MNESERSVGSVIYRLGIKHGLWVIVLAWTVVAMVLAITVTSILDALIWQDVSLLDMAMSGAVAGLITPPIAYSIARLQWQLNSTQQKLQKLLSEDALTGTATRSHFGELAMQLVSEKSARNMPACVLMLDVDNFKSINDARGHAAGDTVLREFAATLRGVLRAGDVLGRYGGEEFSILLPSTSAEVGRLVAERLRIAVLTSAALKDVAGRAVTMSVGMVSLEQGADLDVMLAAADRALYRAKNQGRDQVCETVTVSRPDFANALKVGLREKDS